MKNPNGFGSVKKLSGNRRRPFAAMITAGWKLNECGGRTQIQKAIGYYATRKEALLALAEYHKSPIDLNRQSMTFAQAYGMWIQEKSKDIKAHSLRVYNNAFDKCTTLHNMRMASIRQHHLQNVLDEYANFSMPVLEKIISVMRGTFYVALQNDIIVKDCTQGLKARTTAAAKKRNIFTAEEVQNLWAQHKNGVKNVDSILFMLYTGVRISEMLNIKITDVDLKARIIAVHGTKTKAADRFVPIHQKIIGIVQKQMKNEPEYLFCSNSTFKKYRRSIFSRIYPNHTPHECRHSFISYAVASGMDERYIKKIVGHAGGNITSDVYTHTIKSRLIQEIDKFTI